MLDKISEEHSDIALDVLNEYTSVWGICSCPLAFAYENSVYDVVAHTCTKNYLKRTMKVEPRVMKKREIYTSTAYVLTISENNIRQGEWCSMLLGKDQAND